MNREISSLVGNNTWELVSKLRDRKVLDIKWIYKNKANSEYKARLVVEGSQQSDGVDDTYAPVDKTLKLLLAYCCQNSLEVHRMDVKTAFLNEKVLYEVYVKQSIGLEDSSGREYKLKKSLYGLKEISRAWYECVNEFATTIGFRRCKYDYCLYVKNISGLKAYLLLSAKQHNDMATLR